MTQRAPTTPMQRQVLDQACVLIASRGVRELTVSAVAEAMGVASGQITAHFPDLNAIVAAIAMEGFRELPERMATVTMQDAEGRLAQLGQQYIYFAWERPTHYRVMFRAMPGTDARQTLAVSAPALTFLRDAVMALMGGEDEVALLSAWTVVHGVASSAWTG